MPVPVRHGVRWLTAACLTGAFALSPLLCPAVAAARESPAACLAARSPSWTAQETWVWERLCAREVADLGNAERFGSAGAVSTADGWSSRRVLRAEFIEDILTSSDLTEHVTDHEIQIHGAWIRDPLDLGGASIESPVHLMSSRFEGDVIMRGVRSTGDVGFHGSHLPTTLDLDGAEIGGSLFLSRARVGSVIATAADFANAVDLSDSMFTGVVGLAVTEIGGGLFMNRSTFQARVTTIAAQVSGATEALDAVFHAGLELEGTRFGTTVLLGGATLDGELDLSGASIGGSLALVFQDRVIDWRDGSSIRLIATTADALDDSSDAWPEVVHLEGFTLHHPHGVGYSGLDPFIDRSAAWYIDWLERDDGFSRGAYLHVEHLLRGSGRPAEADEVGMARADLDASSAGSLKQLVSLVYRYTVGYGYHPERAALWAVGLIITGALVALLIPVQKLHDKGASSRLVLSAHRLIPLISFGDAYSQVDTTSPDVPGLVRWYFCIHAVLGYVLAAALVAALSGVVSTA